MLGTYKISELSTIYEELLPNMNFCGLTLDATQMAALGSFAFAIASEVIGRSKLKENSVVDIAMNVWRARVTAPAHTPAASDRKVPSAASPAPRRPGRPPSSKTASQTAPKKASR